MRSERIPLGAQVLRILVDIGLAFIVVLFLAPIFLMIAHHVEVKKAEAMWQETVRTENAKTEKSIKSFQDAMEKAKVKK